MRIEQSTKLTVPVEGAADDVLAVLEDQSEVQDFVAPLLDESTEGSRWVVEPVKLGPVTIRPVCDVNVIRTGDVVMVRGRPVPAATPTWLDVSMTVIPRGVNCSVQVSWGIRVDLPGPQFVARLARPLLDAEAKVVTHDLTTRLQARFAAAADDTDVPTDST